MSVFAPVRPASVSSLLGNGSSGPQATGKAGALAGLQPVAPVNAASLLTGGGNAYAKAAPGGNLLQPVAPLGAASLLGGDLRPTRPPPTGILAKSVPAPKLGSNGGLMSVNAVGAASLVSGAANTIAPKAASASSAALQPLQPISTGDSVSAAASGGGLQPVRAVSFASLISSSSLLQAEGSFDPAKMPSETSADPSQPAESRSDASCGATQAEEIGGSSSSRLNLVADSSSPSGVSLQSIPAVEEGQVEEGGLESVATLDPYLATADPYLAVDAETVAASGDSEAPVKDNVEMDKDVSDFLAQSTSSRNHVFLTSVPGIGKTTMVQKLLEKLQQDEGKGAVEVDGFFTEEVRDAKGQRAGFDVVRVGGSEAGSRCALARAGEAHPKVGKYTVKIDAFDWFALPTLKFALSPDAQAFELPENPRLLKRSNGDKEIVSLLQDSVEIGTIWAASTVLVRSTGIEETITDPSLLEPVPDGWTPPIKAASSKEPRKPKLLVCDEVGKMELLSIKFGPAFLKALDGEAVVLGTLPMQQQKSVRDHEVVDTVKKRRDVKVCRLTRNNRDASVAQVYGWLRDSLGLTASGEPPQKRQKVDQAPTAEDKPQAASAPDKVVEATKTNPEPKASIAPVSEAPAPAKSPPPASPEPAPASSPPPLASPMPMSSPAPSDEADEAKAKKDKKEDKKDKKEKKKEEKAKKKEEDRLEGLRRAAERKKRREAAAANAANASNTMEIDD